MRVLLAAQPWPAFGGSETYLVTVATALERLGHPVEIYAPAKGELADLAADAGVRRLSDADALPERPDVVVTQDGASATELAARYPESRRVFVSHSPLYEPQRPPVEDGVCQAVVVLGRGAESQMESLAGHPEIVRLRQPIDLERFADRSEPRPRARRVLAFGHHWGGDRYGNYRLLAAACERLGLELVHVGRLGKTTLHPEFELLEADIVVGTGRCILEAMACARAAYVFGTSGFGGWVTPENYVELEGRAFTSADEAATVELDQVIADLERYDPEMGRSNRQLAVRFHGSARHAAGLVALFERLEGPPRVDAERLDALARAVRVQHQTERRAAAAEWDAKNVRIENERLRGEFDRAWDELEGTKAHLAGVFAGRRYRLGSALVAPALRIASLGRRTLSGLRSRRERARNRRRS